MQTKIRYAIAHKSYSGSYINKGANNLTTDLDQAITFSTMSDASEWFLNAVYAPVDKECYKYAQIEVTKRDLEEDKLHGELFREIS
jgi:hypothetical protein